MHPLRTARALAYHTWRAIDGPRSGQIALLIADKHFITQAWLVELTDDQEFDLPSRTDGSEITIRPHGQRFEPRCEHPEKTKWLLLSEGHAREVSLNANASQGGERTVRLGAEWLQGASKSESIPGLFGQVSKEDAALAVYSEAGNHVRALIDVRFKLLALLPAVSALALVAIVSPTGPLQGASDLVRVTAAVAGFLVVLGIRIYDVRNSQLHDDLISRARSLEASMGIERGVFMRRRKAAWPIQHDTALFWVYTVVLLAWLAAALVPLV